ncbi:MAG: hypothetical protein Fur0016_02150 [Anaerolineales bacterium]
MTPSPTGLLISQIGYDLRAPMRAIWRGALTEGASFRLQNESGETILEKPLTFWGNCWGSDWWIADFSELTTAGAFTLTLEASNMPPVTCPPFNVGEYHLWHSTVKTVAIEQFERRAELARFGNGWKDCGSDMREVGSHTGALIGLLDLLNIGLEWLGPEDGLRLAKQIMHGCDYLVLCQQRADDLGWPPGSVVHEIPNHPVLIPQDQGQFVVAIAKASRHIYELDRERGLDYLNRAAAAYEFLTRQCQPSALPHFSAKLHGAPEGYLPSPLTPLPQREGHLDAAHLPTGEEPGMRETGFMTADLLMMVWGAVELAKSGKPEYLEEAIRRADQILSRQVAHDTPEGEFYGHFYTFDDHLFTEKAFTHHHVGHDTSLMFNHYLVPLLDLCDLLPKHPEQPRWRQAVRNFAYGYFLPACQKNPFYLLPQGYYAGQGLLSFCGPWHGFNVCYGYAAAQAIRFEIEFGDPAFRPIAVGNLQWIAGLNAGLTSDSFEGSVMWRETLPEGRVVSYSFIEGIGANSVKTWSRLPGSIGNGVCTNRQFQMEVEPSLENDIPRRYSDEDWIPHAGGFLSGLVHLRQIMGWSAR